MDGAQIIRDGRNRQQAKAGMFLDYSCMRITCFLGLVGFSMLQVVETS